MIRTTVSGLAETKRKMEQVAGDLHGAPTLQAFRSASIKIANAAKRYAPVDTGRLRASITPDVIMHNNVVRGAVGSNVVYAPYMELGTGTFAGKGRHHPPSAALETWARRHGTTGFVVARAIARRGGLRPRRFLQRAFDENRDGVVQEIARAVRLVVEK